MDNIYTIKYYSNIGKKYYTFSNELYHHGVKGQRWGVRRYQNIDGSLTSEGKIHYSKIGKKVVEESLIKYVRKNDTGEEYINAAELFMKEQNSPYKTALLNEHKDGKPINKDLIRCNLDRYQSGKYTKERRQNCAKCSTAMDLMSKGYMVKAGSSKNGYTVPEITSWYKNTKVTSFDKFTGNVVDVFRKSKSGILCMHTPICDHAIYYNNGSFYDGQIRKKFTSMQQVMVYYKLNFDCRGDFIDTTLATPNFSAMKKDETVFLDVGRKKIKNGN